MVDVKPYSILNLHCNLYVDHVVVKYYIVLLLLPFSLINVSLNSNFYVKDIKQIQLKQDNEEENMLQKNTTF